MEKTVVIKPTFTCNFHCWYCTERRKLHNKLANKKSILIDEWEVLLKRLFKLGFTNLTLSGAEPTLYPHYDKLLEILSSINYNTTTIMTNGSYLDKVDVNYFKYVEISFADIDKKSFKKNRGVHSEFEQQYKAIVSFLKKKKNLAINCIPITEDRLLNLDKILYLTDVLGFDDINLQPLEGNFKLKPINNHKIYTFTTKVYPKIPKRFLPHVDKVIQLLKLAVNGVYRTKLCTIPNNQLIILGNGDVHFCNIIEYTHEKEGQININKHSFGDMFDKIDEFEKVRSKYCYRCPMQLH